MEEPPKSTRSRKVSGMMCEAGRPKNRSPQQRKGGKRALWLAAVVLLLCGRSGPGVCRCLAVGPGLRVPLFRCASFVVAWSFLPALGSFGGTFWTGADPRTAHCWVFRYHCTPSFTEGTWYIISKFALEGRPAEHARVIRRLSSQ